MVTAPRTGPKRRRSGTVRPTQTPKPPQQPAADVLPSEYAGGLPRRRRFGHRAYGLILRVRVRTKDTTPRLAFGSELWCSRRYSTRIVLSPESRFHSVLLIGGRRRPGARRRKDELTSEGATAAMP